MEQKDPKDMTASEQLRWAANGEPYNGIDENIWTCPTGKIKALEEAVTGKWPSDNEIFSIVADKIDAELAQARELSLRRGAEIWAKANGWPDFREGEDFGAWLDRCAMPRPRYEDGEPVLPCDEWKAIIMSLDGARFQLLETYPDGLCFTGDLVKRPAPEVLGADGLPIVVGETVWLADEYSQYADSSDSANESEYSLLGVDSQEALLVEDAHLVVNGKNYVRLSICNAWCPASWITHTRPDTQEKIDEDKRKSSFIYWGCANDYCNDCPAKIDGKIPREHYGVECCSTAQGMDIARRQYELDKRKGGAE